MHLKTLFIKKAAFFFYLAYGLCVSLLALSACRLSEVAPAESSFIKVYGQPAPGITLDLRDVTENPEGSYIVLAELSENGNSSPILITLDEEGNEIANTKDESLLAGHEVVQESNPKFFRNQDAIGFLTRFEEALYLVSFTSDADGGISLGEPTKIIDLAAGSLDQVLIQEEYKELFFVFSGGGSVGLIPGALERSPAGRQYRASTLTLNNSTDLYTGALRDRSGNSFLVYDPFEWPSGEEKAFATATGTAYEIYVSDLADQGIYDINRIEQSEDGYCAVLYLGFDLLEVQTQLEVEYAQNGETLYLANNNASPAVVLEYVPSFEEVNNAGFISLEHVPPPVFTLRYEGEEYFIITDLEKNNSSVAYLASFRFDRPGIQGEISLGANTGLGEYYIEQIIATQDGGLLLMAEIGEFLGTQPQTAVIKLNPREARQLLGR